MIFKCIYYYCDVKRMGPELTSGPGWRHESPNSHGITIYLIMNNRLLILNKDMLLFPSVRVNQIVSELLGHKKKPLGKLPASATLKNMIHLKMC